MLPLFLIVFIDLIGFGIMMPLLPYYAAHFGADAKTVSLLFTMYSLGQFVAAPVWGKLSDRFGRKPILMLSVAGGIVCYVAIGFADALWMLFVARLCAGLMAGNISTAMAYIADITTPANRSKGMGVIGAAFGLGFIFGPVLGGVLAGSDPANVDFALPSFAAAGLSTLALVGVIVALRESLPPERRAELRTNPRTGRWAASRLVLAQPNLRQLILTVLVITTAMGAMETSFTIWIYRTFGWGPEKVSEVFAYIGVIMAIIQGGLIGRLTRRFGEVPILIAGCILLLVGLLALPFSPNLAVVMLSSSLLAIGYGLAQPTFNSLISQEAEPAQVGLVMGVSQAAGSLSRVIGPLLSSLGFACFGLKAPFLIAALLVVPGLVSAWRLRGRGAARTGTRSPG